MANFTKIARCIAYAALVMVSGCNPELENAGNGDNRKYYYAFDEKIPLYEVPNRMVVTFDKEHRSSIEEYLVNNARISKDKLQIREGHTSDFSVITVSEGSDKMALRDALLKQTGVISVRQVYALDDGYEMVYVNEIILQFKSGASQQEISEMHKKFNVEIIKTTELYVLLYVPVESDPLDVANAYQESGLTNYSTPSFITGVSNFYQFIF